MTTPRTVEPSLRHGDFGERWGNLVAPNGAFAVGDLFRLQGDEDAVQVVRRVLSFPADPSKRLVHYESTAR